MNSQSAIFKQFFMGRPQKDRSFHRALTCNWRYLAKLKARHKHRRSPELIELFAQARFQTSIHAFEVLHPPNPDYMQLINNIHIPSLLITGGMGSVVSSSVAAKLARLNKHFEVMQIAEAGHAIPYDHPDRFSAVIKSFLRNL